MSGAGNRDGAGVTLAADGQGVISANVNAQPMTEVAAVASLTRASRDGQVPLLEVVRIGLSRPAASRLHRDPALAGNHDAVASAALGRVISSLTQVQPHEAEQVRGYAARLIRGAA